MGQDKVIDSNLRSLDFWDIFFDNDIGLFSPEEVNPIVEEYLGLN